MRIVKLIGWVVGGLAGLLLVLLVGVWLFVSPDAFKGRLEEAVKRSTGRELSLSGHIKLSIFPWVALEFGPATLGNPPGFGTEPFATLQHASVRVRLLPLLSKQLDVGRVEIDGLDLRLLKNAAGKGNWEGFTNGSTSPADTAKPTAAGAHGLPALEGLTIKDSRVSFQDMAAEQVNFEIGALHGADPVPVQFKLVLQRAAKAAPLPVAGHFAITLSPTTQVYGMSGLELEGTLPLSGAKPAPWKLAMPSAQLDLDAQTLSAPAFTAGFGAASLAGALRGSKVIDKPAFEGSFKLEPLALRDFLTQLGSAPGPTRDPKVYSRLAASGQFAYSDNALRTSGLEVQLDDSQLRGSAGVTDLATMAYAFDLSLDRLDVDRYLAPAGASSTPGASAATPGSGATPDSALRTLNADGKASIGSVHFAGYALSDVQVGVKAHEGIVHLAPVQARLYGGGFTGTVTLDARSDTPAFQIEESLSNIDVLQLLKDSGKTQRLSGRGNVTVSISARGMSSDAILRSANGHVTAALLNGAVEGLDLWFEINRAVTLLQKQQLASGSSSGRTRFDTFKASADLHDGVATTKDLAIASGDLKVTGQGSSNLLTEAIDYRVLATLLKPTAGGAATKLLSDLPVTITGSMSSPTVRPDLAGLAKAQVQQELDSRKQQLQQQLQNTVQDKLKGLFH